MSTTASKVHQLIREAREFLESGDCTDVSALVKDLTDKLTECHPIANRPTPAVENPNVVAWRPHVVAGLQAAIAEIRMLICNDAEVTGATHIRRSTMKDGGVKAKLGIKFEAKMAYTEVVSAIKIIQRNINEQMTANGLSRVAVIMTAGSQLRFSARVYVEGDHDYDMWARISSL